MNKLPYTYIEFKVFKLISLIACVKDSSILMDELNDYLELSGWSDENFDKELLKRIDLNWDLQFN